jgi:hypothetical protein
MTRKRKKICQTALPETHSSISNTVVAAGSQGEGSGNTSKPRELLGLNVSVSGETFRQLITRASAIIGA